MRKRYNYDLLEKLPEIVWNLPNGKVSTARYHYHDFISELFTGGFADNCGRCVMSIIFSSRAYDAGADASVADRLSRRNNALISRFRNPGIDMLCNSVELSTAKQCQSAVHQYGREAMVSELYGVTNWDFDFRGHKFQGDWQAALGVTIRVPHLSWVSMAGEAKRDYPASINYQSPWYKEYKYIENHFARVNTALTRGKQG